MTDPKLKCGHPFTSLVLRYTADTDTVTGVVCLECERIEAARKAGLLEEEPVKAENCVSWPGLVGRGICARDHAQIAFNSDDCPLCAALAAKPPQYRSVGWVVVDSYSIPHGLVVGDSDEAWKTAWTRHADMGLTKKSQQDWLHDHTREGFHCVEVFIREEAK